MTNTATMIDFILHLSSRESIEIFDYNVNGNISVTHANIHLTLEWAIDHFAIVFYPWMPQRQLPQVN